MRNDYVVLSSECVTYNSQKSDLRYVQWLMCLVEWKIPFVDWPICLF